MKPSASNHLSVQPATSPVKTAAPKTNVSERPATTERMMHAALLTENNNRRYSFDDNGGGYRGL